MDVSRLVNGFLGSGGLSGAAQAAGPAAGNIADRASQAMSGMPGGLAGGAAAGGLVALMLGTKTGRKMGGKALKYGGIAAVGGLAYMAYRNYKTNQTGGAPQQAAHPTQQHAPIPTAIPDASFDPAGQQDSIGEDMRLGLLRAMISAANADGHIDQAEHAAIRQQIEASDLAGDEKGFLFDAMGQPSDPIGIANLATNETQGAELYVASVLTIDVDTPEERRYMDRLGDALRLPDALRAQLEAQAQQAKEAAVNL